MRSVLFFVSVISVVLATKVAIHGINPPDWKQCDPSWGEVHVGNCSATICTNGATETCIAMLMASRGYNGTPGTLVKWLNKNNGYKCFGDICFLNERKTDDLGFTKYFKMVDNISYYQICDYVDKGYGVLAYFTQCERHHNVLITGFYGESMYSVLDPNGTTSFMHHSEACQFELFE